jgi:hypothetical protein
MRAIEDIHPQLKLANKLMYIEQTTHKYLVKITLELRFQIVAVSNSLVETSF